MSSQSHKADLPDNKITSQKRSRKIINVTVYFLDDSSHIFQLQAKNLGEVLFEKVCKHINLVEVDYFGLECEDEKGTKFWLDSLKPLCAQLPTSFPTMYFCVKFYTPDPVQLEDEYTRYLFCLQIKKDLMNNSLQCNDNTAAVLISYIVQADFGDFNPEKCVDHTYLSSYKFVPYQDAELEKKIMENHKKLIGQTPAEADLNLLETARRCELYGIKMTAAKDQEGVPLNLAVAHLGVLVFQNYTKINTFSWVKIRKLSFKRKKFLIKLHPEGYGYYKDTVDYFFESRNECKNFWKKCIENHTFFRCTDAKQGMRQKTKIFSRGSSFRYSGRTQKQVSEFVRENCLKRSSFQRSTSLKTPTSPTRSIGLTMTPQPLLPVSSLSCGSMSDISKTVPSPPKVTSTSEPSTPHVPADLGNGSKTLGGVSLDSGPDGFQSSDFFPKDTDDNTSHDSYHVLEKEALNLSTLLTTNSDNIPDNKSLSPNSKDNSGEEIKEHSIEKTEIYNLNHSESINALENNNNTVSLLGKSALEQNLNHSDVNYPLLSSSTSLSQHFNDDIRDITGCKNSDSQEILDNDIKNISKKSNEEEHDSSWTETEQNFGSSTFYVSSPLAVRLSNRKRVSNDEAYYLAKELLMTERTFRKDLEIINVVFREEFYKQTKIQSEAIEHILSVIDPLYEMHCSLLRDVEQRLAFWEGRHVNKSQQTIKGVADILLQHREMVKVHSTYLEKLSLHLEMLYKDLNEKQNLAQMYQQFESQKSCYLPLTSFFLRPTFRLLYYSSILQGLLNIYNSAHVDYYNCIDMLGILKMYCGSFENTIKPLVNYAKLMELQRSLHGFPYLVTKTREFIREGCLLKFTKTGSHQHMFFLFSDILLYTARVHDGQLYFKVQGQLSTEDLKVQDTEPKLGVKHCFLLCTSEKHLLLASSSINEYAKWMEDLEKVKSSSRMNSRQSSLASLKSDSYEEEVIISSEDKPTSHHINTSIHICWHRNISISCKDILLSMKTCMSGYLLRKFKNSSNWQKVWVVLANFCLFFYRSYLDECPLASLPLVGYRIMNTCNSDLVSGDNIFKLVYKNHEYFFMVENKYSYKRWMEAIHICTLIEEENTQL